jgi:hypothetical protein
MTALKILIFDWNSDHLNICSSLGANKSFGFNANTAYCFKPAFIKTIKKLITDNNINVAVFTTQIDSNSEFHEKLLPSHLKNFKIDTISDGPLKMSVCYLKSLIKFDKDYKFGRLFHDYYTTLTIPTVISKGLIFDTKVNTYSLAAYYTYNGASYVFVAVAFAHLTNLSISKIKDVQDVYLNHFISEYINKPHVDYGFISGDMNYQLNDSIDFVDILNRNDYKTLITYDELYPYLNNQPQQKFSVSEGVNNQGPLFMPTWFLKDNRSLACKQSTTTTTTIPNNPITGTVNLTSIRNHINNYEKNRLINDVSQLRQEDGIKYAQLIKYLNTLITTNNSTNRINASAEIDTLLRNPKTNIINLDDIKQHIETYYQNRKDVDKKQVRDDIRILETDKSKIYKPLISYLTEIIKGNFLINYRKAIAEIDTIGKNNAPINPPLNSPPKTTKANTNISNCFNFKFGIGYHDRILYTDGITCTNYDRLDIGTNYSHHAAVYGVYTTL